MVPPTIACSNSANDLRCLAILPSALFPTLNISGLRHGRLELTFTNVHGSRLGLMLDQQYWVLSPPRLAHLVAGVRQMNRGKRISVVSPWLPHIPLQMCRLHCHPILLITTSLDLLTPNTLKDLPTSTQVGRLCLLGWYSVHPSWVRRRGHNAHACMIYLMLWGQGVS